MPITLVQSSDTPNAGRGTWNANDTDLQAQITADAANLTTHKASTDHNGLYYTEGEIDAQRAAHNASGDHDARYIALTGDQSVDGIKKFTSGLQAKAAVPAVYLLDPTDVQQARIEQSSYGTRNYITFFLRDGSGLQQAIVFTSKDTVTPSLDDGRVDLQGDIYATNKKVATEEYVQARLRSGSRVLAGQTASLALGAGAAYTQINGVDQLLAVPVGTEITWINAYSEGGTIKTIGSAVNVANEPAIKIRVTASANSGATATVSLHRPNGDSLGSVQGGQGMNGIFAVSLTL